MNVSFLFSSLFGVGFIPVAPGTMGSLFGLATFWFIPQKFSFTLTGILFFFSLIIISKTQKYVDSKDDPRIVIDEMLGMWAALCFVPNEIFFRVSAFAVFRFFDVLKPWGIKEIQSFPDAWGVVFDDMLAAFYTIATINLASFFWRTL